MAWPGMLLFTQIKAYFTKRLNYAFSQFSAVLFQRRQPS